MASLWQHLAKTADPFYYTSCQHRYCDMGYLFRTYRRWPLLCGTWRILSDITTHHALLVLPMMFKRQFIKYQFGKSEQGIELFQDYIELYANGRKQTFQYAEVQHFAIGKLTYMLEFKNRTVIIVPKRAFLNAQQQAVFENTFKK